jgi:DNA-binding transcriptional LysR family regulator
MLDKDMISMRISNPQPTAIVATPEYFTRFGTPKAPEDLKHHRCLAFRYTTSGVIHRWQFSRNDQTFIFDPPARFISNDNDMIVAAALDGIGIACILESQAIPHQKSGGINPYTERLVPAHPAKLPLLPQPPSHEARAKGPR